MLSAVLVALALATSHPGARLHVALAFDGGAGPSFEAAVIEEAGRVWAAYGIEINRLSTYPRRPAAAVTLQVSLAQRPARGNNDGALASIVFHDGVAEPRISLYVATATDLMSSAAREDPSRWPLGFRDALLARVLGRALAHEIGHYVLNSRAHSKSGLMRAVHPIAELMEFGGGGFALTPDDREALCEILSQNTEPDRT